MNSSFQGIVLFGKMLGHKSRSGVKNGKTWTMHSVGIETPRVNGFPGETIVHQVNITNDMVNSGMLNTIEKLAGKQVSAKVFIRTYATQNGAGYNLSLENDTQFNLVSNG